MVGEYVIPVAFSSKSIMAEYADLVSSKIIIRVDSVEQ